MKQVSFPCLHISKKGSEPSCPIARVLFKKSLPKYISFKNIYVLYICIFYAYIHIYIPLNVLPSNSTL